MFRCSKKKTTRKVWFALRKSEKQKEKINLVSRAGFSDGWKGLGNGNITQCLRGNLYFWSIKLKKRK